MLIILGFLVMLCLYAVVSWLSAGTASVLIFADFPSILLILVPLLFFLFVTKSGKIIGMYCRASFSKNYMYTTAELTGISRAAKNTIKFIMSMGGFGFFTGLIAVLRYLEKPEALGPNLAISLMTVLYAITISFFIFFPLQAWAENRINLLAQEGDTGSKR
jgi:flagellar motor component MotA